MSSKILSITLNLILVSVIFHGCKKFLDLKPDKSLTTINNLEDLQSLLDNASLTKTTNLQDIIADDYYLATETFHTLNSDARDAYIWSPTADGILNWKYNYQTIRVCNVVLSELKKLNISNQEDYNNIKGQALMKRAFSFFLLSQIFAPPFTDSTKGLPSIPLRLLPDIEKTYPRSTVEETYEQIINDLTMAIQLLPKNGEAMNRPDKANTSALLARIFLAIGDYKNALTYSNQYLEKNEKLMDFNNLDPNLTSPIPPYNEEICYNLITDGPLWTLRGANIDSILIGSYDSMDLRKKIFFERKNNGVYAFRGNYGSSGNYNAFAGITVSEMMLIKAECLARKGDSILALDELNKLLIKRFISGKFEPIILPTTSGLLDRILQERRKELIFRSVRWSDIRRLNLEGKNIIMTRSVDDRIYQLLPNDLRYTWIIPNEIMALNPTWEQNKR